MTSSWSTTSDRFGRQRMHLSRAVLASVSSSLVLWMALFPLAQVWHLSVAHHAHRHCPTHDRLEDVADLSTMQGHDSRAGSSLRGNSVAERHSPCPLLNCDAPRKRPLSPPPPFLFLYALPSVTGAAFPRVAPSVSSELVLLSAPKTSPPQGAV